MIYLIVIFLSLHILFVIAVLAGYQRAMTVERPAKSGKPHFATVVVPFRNEVGNLPELINCLASQKMSASEVILVDDHSTDNSRQTAQRLISELDGFAVLTSERQGKKAALETGIVAAKGDIIVTTDADCTFGDWWIGAMVAAFDDEKVKMAFGPVALENGTGLFGEMQRLEFSTVMATGVALHAWNRPAYCNGANLAFRKDAFEAVNGYKGNDHVASGDDQFLLEKMNDQFPGGIAFVNEADALVKTAPQITVHSFFQQRIRWASKWGKGVKPNSKWLAALVWLIQLNVIIAWILVFSDAAYSRLSFWLGVKALFEFILIYSTEAAVSRRTPLLPFLVLQVVYPLYVLYTGIAGLVTGFQWKGRNYTTHQPGPTSKPR